MKEIIARPKVYGFMLRKQDLYPVIQTKKITIDSTIHNLADFAISQKINYKILKMFNPWLRTNSLTNSGNKKYVLELPKNGVEIYDIEGNYEDNDTIETSDSIKLITTFPPAS
jgi:thymidylate synthase